MGLGLRYRAILNLFACPRAFACVFAIMSVFLACTAAQSPGCNIPCLKHDCGMDLGQAAAFLECSSFMRAATPRCRVKHHSSRSVQAHAAMACCSVNEPSDTTVSSRPYHAQALLPYLFAASPKQVFKPLVDTSVLGLPPQRLQRCEAATARQAAQAAPPAAAPGLPPVQAARRPLRARQRVCCWSQHLPPCRLSRQPGCCRR